MKALLLRVTLFYIGPEIQFSEFGQFIAHRTARSRFKGFDRESSCFFEFRVEINDRLGGNRGNSAGYPQLGADIFIVLHGKSVRAHAPDPDIRRTDLLVQRL